MQIPRGQTAAILIAIFLTTSMILVPTVVAQVPSLNVPTFAYINIAPNPVGVGQKVLIVMWLDKTFDPGSAITNDWRFHNYELFITKPDSTTSTQTISYISDPTSLRATQNQPCYRLCLK